MFSKRLCGILRRVRHLEVCCKQSRRISTCTLTFQANIFTRDTFKCQLAPSRLSSYREKFSKKESRSKDESSDSEDESDAEEGDVPEKGSKVVSVTVPSLRIDLLLKSGLQVARNKVEALFYQSRIRVNGKKILKKSIQVSDGDELDVVRGFSPMNPNFLVVSRLEVLSVKAKEENFSVKLRRTKSLVIENYEEPWKQTQSQE